MVEALHSLPPGPKPNPRYFFWSGNGLPKSAVADWQRSYRHLFELTNITRADGTRKRCHPHMFRDTFAVEMLLAGVPIDQVSLLLGHASVKITEKSYSPFVKARQIQLQDSVRSAWEVGEQSPAPDPGSTPPAQVSVHRQSGWGVIRPAKLKAGCSATSAKATGGVGRSIAPYAAAPARAPRPSSDRRSGRTRPLG